MSIKLRPEIVSIRAMSRSGNRNSWVIPTEDHKKIHEVFQEGILENVIYTGEGPDIPQPNGAYTITPKAEMSGMLRPSGKEPKTSRKCQLVFDGKRNVFHPVGNPDEIIESSDFLILTKNGPIAGWK